MNEVEKFLTRHRAERELREFASGCRTLQEFWDQCHRVDWMLWVLERFDGDAERVRPELRLFACACARTVASHLTDERSTNAIDVAGKLVVNLAMRIDLQVARDESKAAAEELARTGDPLAARSAGVAHATTLGSALESAKAACDLLLDMVRQGQGQAFGMPDLDTALRKCAGMLRHAVPTPFRRGPVTGTSVTVMDGP